MTVSVTEARNRLTELLMKIEEGDTVIIERHGKPVAQITMVVTKRKPRFGTMKDRIKILDPKWDAPQNNEGAWLAGDV